MIAPMSVSQKTKQALAFRSGNQCAFKDCRVKLLDEDGDLIGECCHIRGAKPGAARYDGGMTDEDRHGLGNLVYLCRNHHVKIDKNPDSFTVEQLLELKRSHEEHVARIIGDVPSNLSSKELVPVVDHFVKMAGENKAESGRDFSLRAVGEKIRLNDLGENSLVVIKSGLESSARVKDAIARCAALDLELPDRLTAAVAIRYNKDDLCTEGRGQECVYRVSAGPELGICLSLGKAQGETEAKQKLHQTTQGGP